MSDKLAFLDATAEAEMVRRGDISPRELVDAAIARIEKLNPTLNAVIHRRFEQARAEAAQRPSPDAPFGGVPFLLKDIFCYSASEPYHMGARFLRDMDFRAPHDTYLVQRFRAAGFITLGRTNVPELGILPATEPEAYGPTRNPWDTSRSTGGSSGGSCAAVASGMVAVAHANDGGGSIRIPASECGLVGLKPSRGRSSFGPDFGEPIGGLAAEGVVSRSVRDTAGVLDVIAGPMPGDPSIAPAPKRAFREEVGAAPGRLRIGVRTAAPGAPLPVHPDCVAATEAAAKLCESLGHKVELASPDALEDVEAFQHFTVLYSSYLAHVFDVLEMFVGRKIEQSDVDGLNWTMAEMGRGISAMQYLTTMDWVHGYMRRMAQWWEDGFDLLLTPTLPDPPPPLGFFSSSEDPMTVGMRATVFAMFTCPFNMTGQPAISLPLHWNAQQLPIGVQFVASYGREDVLLRLAAQLEEAQPWRDRRPPVHA